MGSRAVPQQRIPMISLANAKKLGGLATHEFLNANAVRRNRLTKLFKSSMQGRQTEEEVLDVEESEPGSSLHTVDGGSADRVRREAMSRVTGDLPEEWMTHPCAIDSEVSTKDCVSLYEMGESAIKAIANARSDAPALLLTHAEGLTDAERVRALLVYTSLKSLCDQKAGDVTMTALKSLGSLDSKLNAWRPLCENLRDVPHSDYTIDIHGATDGSKVNMVQVLKDCLETNLTLTTKLLYRACLYSLLQEGILLIHHRRVALSKAAGDCPALKNSPLFRNIIILMRRAANVQGDGSVIGAYEKSMKLELGLAINRFRVNVKNREKNVNI